MTRMWHCGNGGGGAMWLLLLLALTEVSSQSASRKINILNEGKGRIELFWIHPATHEPSLMSNPDIMPGADFVLDSYVDHMFRVKEKRCPTANSCRTCNFTVSPNDDQTIRVSEDIECDFVDNKLKARQEAGDLVAECHAAALQQGSASSRDAMDALVDCVQRGVAQRLETINEEIAFQATVRRDIAGQLENYTCADDTLNSSDVLRTEVWVHDRDPLGLRRQVNVMHDRPASRIHVINNFISAEECLAMENAARSTLHRATVADGRGGSRLSENRKAMQAGIKVKWHLESQGDPIARLSRRVYDYTNDVLGLDLKEHGQEDLMSIQYFGRGMNDTEPDRYTPHCDGDCTGLPHKHGTRMATMVMYCQTAERGGHTNFRNSGVHVKPNVADAVFFSYIDPITRLADTGFTEHSGCPVYEGHKKIVTQWIRLGVDKENPWDSFNTLGIKHADVREMDRLERSGVFDDKDDDDDDDEDDSDDEDEDYGNDEL